MGTAKTRVGLIGFGAIGRTIAEALIAGDVPGHELAAVHVRPAHVAAARDALPSSVAVASEICALTAANIDLVVEAASQEAVADAGPQILAAGIALHVLSIGALADPATRAGLVQAAEAGGTRIALPAGALAGFRGLLAMRHAGLTSVVYTSTKPPLAWAGTPANAADLAGLTQPAVIFEGSAAEAALKFPKNANLAAAVALAGIGFDHTRVRLIADPTTDENSGRVVAESTVGRLDLTLSGPAAAANPKTSEITSMSVIAALRNSADTIFFV